VQRDSGVPDGSGGVRVSFNGWQGIRTPGNERIVAMPLTLGVSGIVRQFKLNAFADPPVQTSNRVMGWGISLDAFLPIIPASNFVDRGNRLALTGSFVKGAGIGDLLSLTGGAKFPILHPDARINPPLHYEANADNGLVSFDTRGVLHAIEWTAFRVGLQYYLPTTGRWIFSATYTQALPEGRPRNGGRAVPRGGQVPLCRREADLRRHARGPRRRRRPVHSNRLPTRRTNRRERRAVQPSCVGQCHLPLLTMSTMFTHTALNLEGLRP
jgi:hypothetical protein